MVREITNEDVIYVKEAIETCIKEGTPIKHPLLTTHGVLKGHFLKFQIDRNIIADKYFEKDQEGLPIPKEGVENAKMMTDFKSTDEAAMMKELEELTSKKVPVEFFMVSPERPVLTTIDGKTKSFPLKDYLEFSDSVSAGTVAFLNEFFIHE